MDTKNLLFIQYPETSPAEAGHRWLSNTQMSLQKPWPRPKLHGIHFKIIALIICQPHDTCKQVATGRA
jgi:hypothetical protein